MRRGRHSGRRVSHAESAFSFGRGRRTDLRIASGGAPRSSRRAAAWRGA